MVDPLTILGACASALQLFDEALRLSLWAHDFLRGWNAARNDIQRLQAMLHETESTMRTLQAFTLELRKSPSIQHDYKELPNQIFRVACLFSEDMQALKDCLPSESSASPAKKMKFVFASKKVKEILQRLEERKSTASLALGLIGRYNDLQFHKRLVSLEGQFDSLITNQDISAGNTSHQEAITKLHEILGLMEQFHQRTKTQLDMASPTHEAQKLIMSTLESIGQKLSVQQPTLLQGQYEVNTVIRRFQTCQHESLALLKQLRGEITDQNSETPEILETIKRGVDISSEIQREIQSSLRHMDKHLATYHSDIQARIKAFISMTTTQGGQYGAFHATRYMSAENPDLLSKLIRAELKQTLEPMSSLDEKLDKIIGQLAQTASKSAHEKTFMDLPSTETAIPSKASTHALQSASCTSVREIDNFSTTPDPVPLFVVDRTIRFTLGVVKIRILSLRSRSNFACPPERFFTVTVDFWPLPKWNSYGLSAMFSSGRNSHGYYDICPSLLPFRVWSETDLLWQVIDNDDINTLQKMLATRVTLRDAHKSGFSLLQMSMLRASNKIVHFLLDHRHLDTWQLDDIFIFNALSFHAGMLSLLRRTNTTSGACHLSRTEAILPILMRVNPRFQENSTAISLITKSTWNSFCILSPQALAVSTILEAGATRIINTMKSCGIPMQPFTWERSLPLDEQAALLEICLKVGGSPNFTENQDPSESFILSEPPLLITLSLLGNGEYNENSVLSGIRMLTLLIGAGADIYHLVHCRPLMPLPIAFWAYSLGLRRIWGQALGECGLSTQLVHDESCKRIYKSFKCPRSKSTSVVFDSPFSHNLSGLRYRGRRDVEKDVIGDDTGGMLAWYYSALSCGQSAE